MQMTHSGKVLVIDNDPERAAALAGLVTGAGFTADVTTDVTNSTQSLSDASDLDVILCELDLEGVS